MTVGREGQTDRRPIPEREREKPGSPGLKTLRLMEITVERL
jgi:hypothetical protein